MASERGPSPALWGICKRACLIKHCPQPAAFYVRESRLVVLLAVRKFGRPMLAVEHTVQPRPVQQSLSAELPYFASFTVVLAGVLDSALHTPQRLPLFPSQRRLVAMDCSVPIHQITYRSSRQLATQS